MEKEDVIIICMSMGFSVDYDQWEKDGKHWIRFELKNKELDEKAFRWIWYDADALGTNLARGARILFAAGQKAKILQLTQYIQL
jgi:hypothetical protein